jgi:hypothetical protein
MGVTKRPIRKVQWAHMRVRVCPAQLDSRDERGSLPDEVGSPNPRGDRGKSQASQRAQKEISWHTDSEATEDTTRAAAAHDDAARMERRICCGGANMGSEARDGRRYGEAHK